MVEEFNVVQMKSEDYPHVWEIWLKEVKRAHLCICDKFWDSRLAFMINETTEKADEKYVYKKKGKVLGFITARRDGYIFELYVESCSQGQHVGTELLKELRKNHKRLSVSVYKQNINAVGWYEKQGFVREPDQCKPCSLTGFEKYLLKWQVKY